MTKNMNRRAALTAVGSAIAVLATVGIASSPALAAENPDAELLSMETAFNKLYQEEEEAWELANAVRAAAETDPECPRDGIYKRGGWTKKESAQSRAHHDFIMVRYSPASDHANELSDQVGALANRIFATMACRAAGIAVKVRILRLALGTTGQDGDDALEAYQDDGDGAWIENIIQKLEQIAARVS
jgi:hypothetical protein